MSDEQTGLAQNVIPFFAQKSQETLAVSLQLGLFFSSKFDKGRIV